MRDPHSSLLPEGNGVVVVGMGDDGPAGLGQRAVEAVRRAEMLVGGRRHLAFFADHPAEKLTLAGNLEDVFAKLTLECDRRRCVVLASGDPCFFGIGPQLVERIGRERVEIIPQPSSVSLAFARLGLGWEDAVVLSAHGRALSGLLGQAVRARKLAVLTDDENRPGVIASALLEAGMPDCPAFVLEHLGGQAERVIPTSLAELPAQTFARLNLLVLLPGCGSTDNPARTGLEDNHSGPFLGRSENEFRYARGQVTKAEARAVTLAKLQLRPDGVLWDIGAGAGSLSVEAACLMPRGAIYALERDLEQLECLRENVYRHVVPQVQPVAGQAPEALETLPEPDRVFVGGGGSDLTAILRVCLQRLNRRGRLGANAATLESAVETQRCLAAQGWNSELVQLNVARGRPARARTRLEALNPVFIVSGWPGNASR